MLARFIDECCIRGDYAQVQARKFYGEYRSWCERTGEQAMTETAFGTKMRERGIEKKLNEKGVLYLKIGLKPKG